MEKGALILSVTGLLFLLGAPCLPASLTWAHAGADGGDFAAAALRGHLPHPPGAPLYHLLTRCVVRFPGDPARNLSALSLFMAVASTALIVAALSTDAPLAWLMGMLLGLAPAFAAQALIVEVYTTAAFFMTLLVFLVRRAASPWLLGLVWGLGLGVHLSLAGAVVWLYLTMDSRRARLTLLGVALLVAGFIYSSGVLLLGRGSPSPWADFSTLAGWWDYVSASLYHGYVFGLPLNAWPQRLLAALSWWARQFTPVGALLLLMGLRRSISRAELGAWLSLGMATLYSIGYNTVDAWVNLVAYLPLAATLMASGWFRLPDVLRRRSWMPALLVVGLAAVWTLPQACLRGADEAARWAEATLATAPPGATLTTHADGETFALWYLQALGVRPDVCVVDADLLGYAPYVTYLQHNACGSDHSSR